MHSSLPFSFAKKYGVVALSENDDVCLTCRDDAKLEHVMEAKRHLAKPCKIKKLSKADFDRLLEQHYHAQTQGNLAKDEWGDAMNLEAVAQDLQDAEELLDTDQDAPIIRLLNALIAQCLKDKASDVHIESYQHELVFRARVDGVLKTIMRLPAKLAPLVVSRIKVMAKLNIAEKRLPQDGRISLQIAGRHVDVRVSTLPSNHGERVVLRLLDKQATSLKMDDLGLCDSDAKRLNTLMQKPHGIILVTGPTGAGKTTTLYAVLSELNQSTRNILTVEDPIEYDLHGIGQSPVNHKIGMTFARGLRAILRQDPDIVMVGEIRDLETAEIAIQASLTGHLMLSTLHTNTAVGAITRLRDMGVPPYLLAGTLEGVVAQRLVRVLCDCKEAYHPDASLCALLGLNATDTLYRPKGCDTCRGTGYKGRMGLYEILLLDDTLKQMIHDEVKESDLTAYAHQHFDSIKKDGIRKILSGKTSVEEVLRVVDVLS